MKRTLEWLLLCAACISFGIGGGQLITGCSTSQQRKAVNSLFTVGQSVDAAYKSYLDLVVAGTLPTNDVPKISEQYRVFQSAFALAITASTLSSNAPPSPVLLNEASQLMIQIQAIKSAKAKGSK